MRYEAPDTIEAAAKLLAGESGDVKAQGHVTKHFTMKPGTYVLFCNIDNINKDKTVTNHFVKGMHATLTVV